MRQFTMADHVDQTGPLILTGACRLSPVGPDRAWWNTHAFYDGLREFEQDLHQHIHLENNIYFPRAIELEKSLS